MLAILLSLVLPLTRPAVVVDLVEINHVVDEKCCVQLSQSIWWDWCDSCERYDVRDWRLIADTGRPFRHNAKWRQSWLDKTGKRITVDATVMRETWTRYDVELDERKRVAEDLRRKIR